MDRNDRGIFFSGASRRSSSSNPGIFGKYNAIDQGLVTCNWVNGPLPTVSCFPTFLANLQKSLRKLPQSENPNALFFRVPYLVKEFLLPWCNYFHSCNFIYLLESHGLSYISKWFYNSKFSILIVSLLWLFLW